MRREQFRSPPHKLVNCFHRSRDQWRKRAKAYHGQVRELQVRVRDLEASRDHWRAKYFARGGAGAAAQRESRRHPGPAPGAEPPLPGGKRRWIARARTGPHGGGEQALRGGVGRRPGSGVRTGGAGARG